MGITEKDLVWRGTSRVMKLSQVRHICHWMNNPRAEDLLTILLNIAEAAEHIPPCHSPFNHLITPGFEELAEAFKALEDYEPF